jgi:hypothetical protein
MARSDGLDPDRGADVTTPGVIELMTEAADALRREGQPRTADDLLRKRAVQPRRPVVLVAGAPNSGKSSLINALLRRADSVPAGADAVTAAPVSLFYADPERAAIDRYGERRATGLDVATALELATVQGNPLNAHNIRGVQVGVPCPLLERVVVIDSPGLGGLGGGYGALTLQSLHFADALLFLSEVGTPWDPAEIDFLHAASARTRSIIFVLTRQGREADWQAARDGKLASLGGQIPALADCPAVVVDNSLALSALALDNLPRSAAQRNDAGFNELEDALRARVIDRSAARFAAAQIHDLIWPLAATHRTLSAPDEQPAALDADWSEQLDAAARELADERADACAQGLADICQRYDGRLADSSGADRDGLPAELLADLTGLAGQLNAVAADRLVGLADRLLDLIEPAASIRESIAAATEQSGVEPRPGLDPVNPATTRFDNLAVLSSFCPGRPPGMTMMGSGLGLTSGPIVAPPIDIPVGLGVGAGLKFQPLETSNPEDFGSQFQVWMAEQCERVRVTAAASLDRAMAEVLDDIRQAVRSGLAERDARVEAVRRAADDLGFTERAEQARALLCRAVALLDAVGAADR